MLSMPRRRGKGKSPSPSLRCNSGALDLLFSLFGIPWVNPLSVWDTLLGWWGSAIIFCIFWLVWKARNNIGFRDDVLSIQKLKFSFINLLWSETNLFIEDGPQTLVQFFDWVSVT